MKKLFTLLCLCVLCIGSAWGDKITTLAGITSGESYYIGATTGGNDYYFSVNGSSTSASIAGTAESKKSNATVLKFTAVTGGWTIQFESGYYLGLKDSKDNGKVQIAESAVTWTIEEDPNKGLLKLSPNGSYSLQKNNSGTQFGSYANTQTNVWLEAANTGKTLTSIAISGTSKTAYETGESFDVTGLTVTGTYDDASTDDLTDDAEWTIDPATFTSTSQNSVSVTATVDGKTDTKNYSVTVTEHVQTYANTYTSNVELSTEGGTSASAAKVVIGGTQYDAIKAGTGSAAGACVVTIPANTKTLHFHAAGWKGETVALNETINLVADAGVSSNSPFTLRNDPETQDYFTLDPQGATSITFTATSGKRFVIFGVNAEEAPTKALKSIAVSGTPDKTTYVVGEEFDPAGLIVTGTYDDASTAPIISGITWNVTPSGALDVGTTSVNVSATVGNVTSKAYTVNGLTVNKFVETWANTYTSNITLPDAGPAKVIIAGNEYEGIKAGTNEGAGSIEITVPANTHILHLHLAGWGTETVTVSIDETTYDISSDKGIKGNSPFTIAGDPEEYYLTYKVTNEEEHIITLKATSGNRFVLFGVNAEKPITITAAGWATAYVPFNATVSNNVTAYYVKVEDGALVKAEADVIPAGTGVLLKSNDGNAATVTFTAATKDADDVEDNMLVGALAETEFSKENTKYFILANGANGVGFYFQGADNTGPTVTCAAGKAVLAVPTTTAGAKEFFLFDDEPLGIEEIHNSQSIMQNAQYNLNGVRVNDNYKGIVIINGKKVVK